MFKIDEIYWLHPQDRGARTARVMNRGEVAEQVNVFAPTQVEVFIPEGKMEPMVTGVAELGKALGEPISETKLLFALLRSIEAQIIEGGYITKFWLPPINSGRVGSTHSLFRDTFIVFHLGRAMHGGDDLFSMNSQAVVYASIKDRNGWEIGQVRSGSEQR